MQFFRKRGIAIVILIAVIVFCVGFGASKARNDQQGDVGGTVQTVDSSGYVLDDAGLLSKGTVSYITQKDANLKKKTGAVILTATVDTTDGQDIKDYAVKLGNQQSVPGNGIVLVIAKNDNAYLAYQGDDIWHSLPDDKLQKILDQYMEPDFAAGDYDAAVKNTFDAFINWYEEQYSVSVAATAGTGTVKQAASALSAAGATVSTVRGGFRSILKAFLVLLLLGVVLDYFRYRQYQQRWANHAPEVIPPVYRPIFWGKPQYQRQQGSRATRERGHNPDERSDRRRADFR